MELCHDIAEESDVPHAEEGDWIFDGTFINNLNCTRNGIQNVVCSTSYMQSVVPQVNGLLSIRNRAITRMWSYQILASGLCGKERMQQILPVSC